MAKVHAEFRKNDTILALVKFSENGEPIGEVEIPYGKKRHPQHKHRVTGYMETDEIAAALETLTNLKESPKGPKGKGKGSPTPSRVATPRGPRGDRSSDGAGTTPGSDDSVLPDTESTGH